MNPSDYRSEHDTCELLKHFPIIGGEVVVPGYVRFPIFKGKCEVESHHVHHVIGGDAMGRTNDKRNILALNVWVHEWVTEHSRAGRVLSCYELQRQGRIDWAFLSQISRKSYPSIMDTDAYIEACARWPFVEQLRTQLIRRAA